jgi:hypothetical protein
LVIEPPLWKICVRQLRWWHSQCDGKNHPNVPNHQSVIVNDSMMVNTGWMMVNHGDQWWWMLICPLVI